MRQAGTVLTLSRPEFLFTSLKAANDTFRMKRLLTCLGKVFA
jgi:hypothetical protein